MVIFIEFLFNSNIKCTLRKVVVNFVIYVIVVMKEVSVNIVITQWALDSYLDLKAQQVFTGQEYWYGLRLDVLLLKQYPRAIKFTQSKFWSPAQDAAGKTMTHGYKMKWHQIGSGKIQLRLPIALLNNQAYLCEAYVKQNDKVDKRKLAVFKVHIALIQRNQHRTCGVLK